MEKEKKTASRVEQVLESPISPMQPTNKAKPEKGAAREDHACQSRKWGVEWVTP